MDIFKILNPADFSNIGGICSPLLNSKTVSFFNFFRIYKDKTFTCLSNNLEWTDFFFKNELYQYSSFLGGSFEDKPKILFSDNLKMSQPIVAKASQGFKINKTMMMIQPCSKYTDVFFFGSDLTTNTVFENYINNIDFFERFIYFFKDKARDLLKTPRMINIQNTAVAIKNPEPSHTSNMQIKRYYLPGEYGSEYLTAREVQCIYWLAKGKSLEETSIILQISKRTIEQHVANVKRKLGCYKQTAVIYLLMKWGILDLCVA